MRFKSRVTFEPEQSKTGDEWHVLATLSGIRAKRAASFKSQAEAEAWIRSESAGWLQKFEGGRYAPKPGSGETPFRKPTKAEP